MRSSLLSVSLLLSLVTACDAGDSKTSSASQDAESRAENVTTSPSPAVELTGTKWVEGHPAPAGSSQGSTVLIRRHLNFTSGTEGEFRFDSDVTILAVLRQECVYFEQTTTSRMAFSYELAGDTLKLTFDESSLKEVAGDVAISGKSNRDYFRDVWYGKHKGSSLVGLIDEVHKMTTEIVKIDSDLGYLHSLEILHVDDTHLILRTTKESVLAMKA